jgi:arylsulfatase A-like enzyme
MEGMRVAVDLVDRAGSAEIVYHLPTVDVGSPSSQTTLISGWGDPELHAPTGDPFVWAVSRTASLEVPLLETGFDRLEFRCRGMSWGDGPLQILTVSINGRELKEITLAREFADHSVSLPGDAVRFGRNRLDLRFAWTARPVEHLPGAVDGRNLAAAFQRVAFRSSTEGGMGKASAAAPQIEGDRLLLAAGSGFRYRFAAPEEAILEVDVARPDGDLSHTSLKVWAAAPGQEAVGIATIEPASAPGRPQRLKIKWPVGEVLELGLAAVGSGGAEDTAVITDAKVWRKEDRHEELTNVLLIVVDTLRADYLGAYGAEVRTPNIDGLAAKGVLFGHARAHIPITGPSHACLFTSLLPMEHGVLNNAQALGVGFPSLAETLKASGRFTAAVISLGVLQRQFGFDHGFDHFGDDFPRDWLKDASEVTGEALKVARAARGEPFFLWVHYSDPHEPYAPADEDYPRFELRLNGTPLGLIDAGGRGFRFDFELPAGDSVLEFLPLDPRPGQIYRVDNLLFDDPSVTIEALDGWRVIPRRMGRTTYESIMPASVRLTPPGGVPAQTSLLVSCKKLLSLPGIRTAYAGEVEFVDRQIGRLLTGLDDMGLMTDTLVVFLSDHGEGLGNHNHVGHISQLYDSLLHVPLILSWPGRLPEGVAIDAPVSLIDVFPTVADLLGLELRQPTSGVSLAPMMLGEEVPTGAIIAATYRPESFSEKRAIVRDGFKYIHSWKDDREKEELFDLTNDPGELANLAGSHPEILARLRTELARRLAEMAESSPVEVALSDEDRAHLRALGYLH